jgi:hypothetical protein
MIIQAIQITALVLEAGCLSKPWLTSSSHAANKIEKVRLVAEIIVIGMSVASIAFPPINLTRFVVYLSIPIIHYLLFLLLSLQNNLPEERRYIDHHYFKAYLTVEILPFIRHFYRNVFPSMNILNPTLAFVESCLRVYLIFFLKPITPHNVEEADRLSPSLVNDARKLFEKEAKAWHDIPAYLAPRSFVNAGHDMSLKEWNDTCASATLGYLCDIDPDLGSNSSLLDPITRNIQAMPLVASDGHSYDSSSLVNYFVQASQLTEEGRGIPKLPLTRKPFTLAELQPSIALLHIILQKVSPWLDILYAMQCLTHKKIIFTTKTNLEEEQAQKKQFFQDLLQLLNTHPVIEHYYDETNSFTLETSITFHARPVSENFYSDDERFSWSSEKRTAHERAKEDPIALLFTFLDYRMRLKDSNLRTAIEHEVGIEDAFAANPTVAPA